MGEEEEWFPVIDPNGTVETKNQIAEIMRALARTILRECPEGTNRDEAITKLRRAYTDAVASLDE